MLVTNQKHYAAAISAFVIWGFFSLPLRAIKAFTPGEILYFRILFSAITLIAVILLFKKKDLAEDLQTLRKLPKRNRRSAVALTLAGGALLCVNWLTFIHIVNEINIKTASFSYLICPVITAVLGFVLIKEKLTGLQWMAVGLCAVSCIMIGLNSALELGYSFLTAFTYALYLISQRKNQGFDRIVVLGVQILFSLLLLSLLYKFLVQAVPDSTGFYGIIAIIAVLFTVVPLFLNLYALNKINSATIGILMYINPIFNFTLAIIVFNETVTVLQWTGYLLIIAALVLFNYPHFRRMQTAVGFRKS